MCVFCFLAVILCVSLLKCCVSMPAGQVAETQAAFVAAPPPPEMNCVWTGYPSHTCDPTKVKGHPIFGIPVCFPCIYEYFSGEFTSGAAALTSCFCL